jgi:ribosome-binding factor A
MSHEFARAERVGAEMRRLLAMLLQDEVRDPRLGMVTLQEVRVTRDLAHAKVYFTCLDEAKVDDTGRVLKHSAGFLRRRLGQLMKLRTVPELEFAYDRSVAEGNRLSALIDRAVAEDESRHPGEAD